MDPVMGKYFPNISLLSHIVFTSENVLLPLKYRQHTTEVFDHERTCNDDYHSGWNRAAVIPSWRLGYSA